MGLHKYVETKSPCRGVFVYLEQNTRNVSLKKSLEINVFLLTRKVVSSNSSCVSYEKMCKKGVTSAQFNITVLGVYDILQLPLLEIEVWIEVMSFGRKNRLLE